jgi:hypothetical protein
MEAEVPVSALPDDGYLSALREDARRRVPSPPPLDDVIEDVGRQRLAAYYLYSALLAGLIDDDDLAASRWPAELAEPMRRLGLDRLAPLTRAGLDVQLTTAEQGTLRRQDRQPEFAHLLVGLINQRAFGPLCGAADSVRLTTPSPAGGGDLELIKDSQVIGRCNVVDHWELVAQYLAGTPELHAEAEAATAHSTKSAVERQIKETGISHAVSVGTDLAVSIHPLGAAVGYGTRLVRARVRTGREEAGTLRDVGQELSTLYAQARQDLTDLQAQRTGR